MVQRGGVDAGGLHCHDARLLLLPLASGRAPRAPSTSAATSRRRCEKRIVQAALTKHRGYNSDDVVSLKQLADFATAALYNPHCRYWHGRPATVRWPAGSCIEDLPPECEGIPGVDPDAESVQLALTHGS